MDTLLNYSIYTLLRSTTVHRSILKELLQGIITIFILPRFRNLSYIFSIIFCKNIPSSRIWTSDLWMSLSFHRVNRANYSPPLYQLSYRRGCVYIYISRSCSHQIARIIWTKKLRSTKNIPSSRIRTSDLWISLLFWNASTTTVHRSTNWAIEGL